MSIPQVERITKKQAGKQITIIVFPLFLYSLCNLFLQYAPQYLETQIINLFGNIDIDILMMSVTIAVCLFVALVPVRISASRLQLDLKAYLKKPKRLNIVHRISLICIGIAIWFGSSALSSGFELMVHSTVRTYSFLGRFTTKLNILRNVLYLICFVIVKPVTEEYIFRAVAQRQLGHYSRFFGVISSAFLYAMVQPTLMDAVAAFAFGWYLAIVTLRYHSISPAIQIHICAALFSWFLTILPTSLALVPLALIVAVYMISAFVLVTGAVKLNIVHPDGHEGKIVPLFFKDVHVILCMITFVIGSILSFF